MTSFLLFIFLFGLNTTTGLWAQSIEEIDSRYHYSRTFEEYQVIQKILADRIKTKSDSPELIWRMAKTLYALGNTSKTKDMKINFFQQCAEHSNRMRIFFPEKAEGHYFNGLCLGKQGQVEGLLNSLFIVSRFRERMETAAQIDPNVEFGGPHRALGRLYQELPGIFGGDLEESIRHLKLATHISPDFPDNHLFLAEALYKNHQFKKAEQSLSTFFGTHPKKDDAKKGRNLLQTIRQQSELVHAQGTDNP